MPPFLPRKRLASTSPPPFSNTPTPRKRTKLTDLLDADPGQPPDLQAARTFTLGEDDSESSLSDIDSDEFEDVPQTGEKSHKQKDRMEEDHDEDIDWEDAMVERAPVKKKHVPMATGNLELNLSRNVDDVDQYDLARAATSTKKGPTKIEREIRLQTHCMHVQFLLYHNALRNCWTCDKEVQDILVKQLPTGIAKEIQKWRIASGLESTQDVSSKDGASRTKSRKKGRRTMEEERSQRDWGKPSTRLENGKPDLSRGDPIIPLLKVLAAYWKKRFLATAPGLRKNGYASAAVRQRQIRSFQNDHHDPEKHGERVASLSEFRKLARKCEGSRDVGAQLFTALLRGIGLESRLIASLQPSGFGWTKNEQAELKKPEKGIEHKNEESLSDLSDEEDQLALKEKVTGNRGKRKGRTSAGRLVGKRKGKGNSNDPVDLDSSSAEDSRLSELEDASVTDVTPATPARKAYKYDRDLPFPIYWTEVVSPVSSVVIPVSPLVLPNPVASTPEILSTFEPRGAKADKGKLVLAYVVAYSADGSAKDVTTRYLKRRMWPGKTKGVRIPVEKVAIYNKRGKIMRYEEYDWFKSVMSGYVRTDKMRTAVDDVEESTDLVPQQPERKENKQEGDTLQSLKSSAEFVLERFLRREEALKPNATPVRIFATGKGERVKEENVYLRADVERCLSAESWHKEGRQIKEGAAPMKLVPIRAVTLTRKREVEEMQRQTGEKPTQGLYCRDQTEFIIPPPIQDGVIPRNSYGNIDCFVPSMVPKGAVHIPMRGTVRICKKLEIDYAEAVTGFEFGKKLAIPVVEGVVVAEEHEGAVRAGWEEYAKQQRVKEEGKLEKAVLNMWKRMLMGLRIRERVSDTYGADAKASPGDLDVVDKPGKLREVLPPGDDLDHLEDPSLDDIQDGGGFLLSDEDDDRAGTSGELVVEHHDRILEKKHREVDEYPTPVSITSAAVKKPSRYRKSIVEPENSPELCEVESVSAKPNGEDSHAELERSKPGTYAGRGTEKRAHIAVEIPKKRQRSTGTKNRARNLTSSEEHYSSQRATAGSVRSEDQIKTIRPSESAPRKRTSGRMRRSAALPQSEQRPKQGSRKAPLTSPYFEPDSDDGDDA
jgi:xeroderma pigmentosum group C-complementing protein